MWLGEFGTGHLSQEWSGLKLDLEEDRKGQPYIDKGEP